MYTVRSCLIYIYRIISNYILISTYTRGNPGDLITIILLLLTCCAAALRESSFVTVSARLTCLAANPGVCQRRQLRRDVMAAMLLRRGMVLSLLSLFHIQGTTALCNTARPHLPLRLPTRNAAQVHSTMNIAPTVVLYASQAATAMPAAAAATIAAPAWLATMPVARDMLVTVVLVALAKIWVKLWSSLAESGMVDSKLTRKLIHTGTGPLFVMGWPFFSNSPYALIAACAVPSINLVRLWLAGRSGADNADSAELAKALSRSGDAKEVAKGPFYYTLVLFLSTLLSFRALPGVIAVCQMAVGDGLADIIGRNFGSTRWGAIGRSIGLDVKGQTKTVEGSLAFVLGAWASSLGMLAGCHYFGYTALTVGAAVLPILGISLACGAVELFSGKLQEMGLGELADDNLTVPFVGAVLAALLLR